MMFICLPCWSQDRQQQVVRQVLAHVEHAGLGPKLRILVLDILRRVGFGVEVVDPRISALAPLLGGRQAAPDEVREGRNLGGGVDDVFCLLQLVRVRPLVDGLARLLRFGLVRRVEEGRPEIRHGVDCGGAREGGGE